MTHAYSATAVWMDLIKMLAGEPVTVSPRGLATREVLAHKTVVDMSRPVVSVAKRKLGFRFLAAEAAWILSGDNRVETIKPFSKEIARFSDDGTYYHGAYGPKIVDQLSHVVYSLLNDLDSRQAVINIWRENPRCRLEDGVWKLTKDVPCTISVQFLVRDGMIHVVDTMRSSDAWLGWPYDVFNFSMLACHVAHLLHAAGGPRLDLGHLHLTAGSQHLYESNMDKVREVLADETPGPNIASLDPWEVYDTWKETWRDKCENKIVTAMPDLLWQRARRTPFDWSLECSFLKELLGI